MDGATPSGNSVSLLNILKLASLYPEVEYETRAKALGSTLAGIAKRYPVGLCRTLQALQFAEASKELVVVAKDKAELELALKPIHEAFTPNLVIAGHIEGEEGPPITKNKVAEGGKVTYYVCTNRTCDEPTGDAEAALREIQN